jgi:hypothetical protein
MQKRWLFCLSNCFHCDRSLQHVMQSIHPRQIEIPPFLRCGFSWKTGRSPNLAKLSEPRGLFPFPLCFWVFRPPEGFNHIPSPIGVAPKFSCRRLRVLHQMRRDVRTRNFRPFVIHSVTIGRILGRRTLKLALMSSEI